MKIDDRVYVHGYVDEIRKDTVIIRNEGGYFGTVKSEIVEAQKAEDIVSVIRCKDCRWYKTSYSWNGNEHRVCVIEPYEPVRKEDDFCSRAERKEE